MPGLARRLITTRHKRHLLKSRSWRVAPSWTCPRKSCVASTGCSTVSLAVAFRCGEHIVWPLTPRRHAPLPQLLALTTSTTPRPRLTGSVVIALAAPAGVIGQCVIDTALAIGQVRNGCVTENPEDCPIKDSTKRHFTFVRRFDSLFGTAVPHGCVGLRPPCLFVVFLHHVPRCLLLPSMFSFVDANVPSPFVDVCGASEVLHPACCAARNHREGRGLLFGRACSASSRARSQCCANDREDRSRARPGGAR